MQIETDVGRSEAEYDISLNLYNIWNIMSDSALSNKCILYFAQERKIGLFFWSMRKICARSTSFVNEQYMRKILLLLSNFGLLSDFTSVRAQALLKCKLRNRRSRILFLLF